jgi:hypothetical protein
VSIEARRRRGCRLGSASRSPLAVGLLAGLVLGACGSSAADPDVAAPSPTVPVQEPATTSGSSGFTATPPGAVGEFVEGSIEFLEWWVGCVAENGHVVEVMYGDPPGLNIVSSGAGRIADRCLETALEEGWFIRSPFDDSAEGNRILYPLYLQVHECLQEHGYPTVDPPSEEAFVEQGEGLWNPYAAFAYGMPVAVRHDGPFLPSTVYQMEAQELCGASREILYQKKLQEQQEGGR